MFADLHHLHQFISLEQGGSVTAESWVGGTHAGEADVYFGAFISRIVIQLFIVYLYRSKNLSHCLFAGATHINADNVHEDWLDDDQASDFAAGVNGPVDRNEVISWI